MRLGRFFILAFALAFSSVASRADDFSFTGNFNDVNDVQLLTFTVGANSPVVILRSWSYAGGVNAAGETIAAGGFDPSLFLFQGTGPGANYIAQNGDGASGLVGTDPVTGQAYDTYLAVDTLAPGIYTVAITDFANTANGPTLGNGFSNGGIPGSDFPDSTGASRDSHWAFDILGVESASNPSAPPVPEPSTLALFGSGLIGLAGVVRRRLSA